MVPELDLVLGVGAGFMALARLKHIALFICIVIWEIEESISLEPSSQSTLSDLVIRVYPTIKC